MVMRLVLVLNNIRSTYNVGAILRTAEGLGVAKVVYAGYTPRYDDNSLLPHLRAKLNRQIERSAIGAEKMVAQEIAGLLGETTAETKVTLSKLRDSILDDGEE